MVTYNENITSIGIDIEFKDRVTRNLWRHLFSHKEEEYINSCSSPLETAAIFFSAKEAFYKMQFPVTGKVIEFKDAEIVLKGNRFVVSCTINNEPFFDNIFTGDFFVTDNHVFTIIHLAKVQCG